MAECGSCQNPKAEVLLVQLKSTGVGGFEVYAFVLSPRVLKPYFCLPRSPKTGQIRTTSPILTLHLRSEIFVKRPAFAPQTPTPEIPKFPESRPRSLLKVQLKPF